MSVDIFLLKLEKDLPKYPYYITDWTEMKVDEDGDMLNDMTKRFISLNKELELHVEKKTSTEFNISNETDKFVKIDSEHYTFYNIKERKTNLYAYIHHNYYRKDGPARIEKNYNYKKKTTSYYCRWYPNLRGLISRQHGPANYRVSVNEQNEMEILSFEWLRADKRFHGMKHREFAPATYSFSKYRWFYNGVEYSSYKYWLLMLEKYPNKYHNVYEDDAKIIIESKAPSPSIIYKKNKNTVWKLNNKPVSMKKYWDHIEKQRKNWYIIE